MSSCNIASHLPAMARHQPDRAAIVEPAGNDAWRSLTFADLDRESDRLARGLERVGIRRGVRTVLFVPPNRDFFPLVFALFKVGAVLVLIDPGLGKRALIQCLAEVEAEAFIGIPAAHLVRLAVRRPFRRVRALVTVGRRLGWGGHDLDDLRRLGGDEPYEMAATAPDDVAAILFTSGSTGIPKGAVYTHGIFDAQVRLIRDLYRIEPGEIDLPTFPLFALFDPALGMTAVLPEMDFRHPAKADPAKIVAAVRAHRCTSLFASPALLDVVSRHAERGAIRLPTLRRILSAGAPVRVDILRRAQAMLEGDAQVFTPFGATESLPVASIGSAEVLAETHALTAAGRGVCVGRPAPGIDVRIVGITDDPIERWSDELLLPQGRIGEITVRGPVVTREYHARPQQTRLAKICDGADVVHRMGDVGYLDETGRLWMCGRKGHRVETAAGTLFTVPVEEVFNRHPAVRRTALVGVGAPGAQRPVLLVEPEAAANGFDRARLVRELLDLGAANPVTSAVTTILLHEKPLPVDVRHNAKIERETLTVWAESRVGGAAARRRKAAGGISP